LCYEKSVAEYTANLSANTLGQYIFGALAHESHAELHNWYEQQRDYYRKMIFELYEGFKAVEPDFIVSRPEASIYFVIDVRKVAKPGFDGVEFASWCAEHGAVSLDDGKEYTLLMAPLNGFYSGKKGEDNPGRTQLRVSFCENPELLRLAPELLSKLFRAYEAQR
jgi:hypothetical protein